MSNINISQNSEGFSLVEMLIALGVSGLLVASVATLFVDAHAIEEGDTLQNEVDRIHLLATYEAKSLKLVSEIIGVTAPTGSITAQDDKVLGNCLSGFDISNSLTNCSAYIDKTGSYQIAGPIGDHSAHGDVMSVLKWSLICSANTCSKVEMSVETNSTAPDHPRLIKRVTELSIPGRFLGIVPNNRASCAINRVLTSIHFTTLSDECANFNTVACAATGPLSGWTSVAANCPPLETITCANFGISQAGIWNATSSCRGTY